MLKHLEKALPESCINKAGDDEPVFVLRAKDPAAPATIRGWVRHRVVIGVNEPHDRQVVEALECADQMEDYRKRVFGK